MWLERLLETDVIVTIFIVMFGSVILVNFFTLIINMALKLYIFLKKI